jgi:hypothetical protein
MSENEKALDVLDRMLAYYAENKRGVGANTAACSYTNGCAVAWACGFSDTAKDWDRFVDDSSIETVFNRIGASFFDTLLPENRIEDIRFWIKMQDLHDSTNHWDPVWNESETEVLGNILTDMGQEKVEEIKYYIANNL